MEVLRGLFRQTNKDNQTLMLIILGAIIFFIFILPLVDSKNMQEVKEKLENISMGNFSAEVPVTIDQNMCSKQCCKFSQWPVPNGLVENTMTEDQMKDYIGSNMSCNFGSGSGCVCFSKNDFETLANRGGNSVNESCSA